jgi:hypothetical protein
MKIILVVVILTATNSCAAARPLDVCVDLPKTTAEAGASATNAKAADAGVSASDAKGD